MERIKGAPTLKMKGDYKTVFGVVDMSHPTERRGNIIGGKTSTLASNCTKEEEIKLAPNNKELAH
jgi:hypothetical protein